MDIEEAKIKKTIVENNILQQVKQFEEETGLFVKRIDINVFRCIDSKNNQKLSIYLETLLD